MRILVASDTHRDFYSLQQAVLQQPKAEVVIHLGDGEDDAEQIKILYPQKMMLQVRGNCDWGSMLPADGEITLEGKHIFYTHGHNYNVKYGMYTVVMAAREKKADILLFGHTHHELTEYEDGLYIMNPGSLSHGSTYGIIDITPAGIVTNIVKLR